MVIFSNCKRYSDLGKYSNVNSYQRTPDPQAELPYICESNAVNSTTSMDYFRFGVNASVKQGNTYKYIFVLGI